MRIPGTSWDIKAFQQLEAMSTTPLSAPLLTGAFDDPLAVATAIAELVKEEKALEQNIEAIRIPSDP